MASITTGPIQLMLCPVSSTISALFVESAASLHAVDLGFTSLHSSPWSLSSGMSVQPVYNSCHPFFAEAQSTAYARAVHLPGLAPMAETFLIARNCSAYSCAIRLPQHGFLLPVLSTVSGDNSRPAIEASATRWRGRCGGPQHCRLRFAQFLQIRENILVLILVRRVHQHHTDDILRVFRCKGAHVNPAERMSDHQVGGASPAFSSRSCSMVPLLWRDLFANDIAPAHPADHRSKRA